MKKLGLISVVLAGVAFTAVGCASEAGLNASGSAQTSASPSGYKRVLVLMQVFLVKHNQVK